MGLDYDRIKKNKTEHGSFWTSYSDLFLMLSTVFLMLYVVATLRSGTFGVEKNVEYKRLTKEAEDLKEQIRVYNALRDEQLAKSSEEENEVYTNLMDKLKLLKEEAKDEKLALRKKAKENERKEDALNQYQQIIRNIINTNVLAKGQIKRRDEMIHTKDVVIENQSADIESKTKMIAAENQEIVNIQSELSRKVQKIKDQQKREKSSKIAMERSIKNLQSKSESRIAQLKEESEKQSAALRTELSQAKDSYEGKMQALKTESQRKLASERATFEQEMKRTQLTAAEREAKEAAFRRRAEGQAQELKGKLDGLAAKAGETERQLKDASARAGESDRRAQEAFAKAGDSEKKYKEAAGRAGDSERKYQEAAAGQSRALASVQSLKKANEEISEDLKRAKELAEAKKNLAASIRQNFQKAGIKAEVDQGTGDVTLSFGDDYFESGQANLTEGMQKRLKTFIPAYTRSLFNDPKTANNIANVEIIGFASPTYKGKYVNPQSLKSRDREAVDYNLRLSFSRANSIFKFIFNRDNLTYEHQETLLPMVKVVGRGYLPNGKTGDQIPDGLPEKKFCEKFNCNRAQKVVIKFNLKD